MESKKQVNFAESFIEIYTDGSSLGNPGKGGWAYIIVENDAIISEKYGNSKRSTNNEMELTAAIEACKAAKRLAAIVYIYTDSTYVKQGITAWIDNWKRNGWKTAKGQTVKNKDLWKELDQAREGQSIVWKWIAAHSGHQYNETVDNLARKAATVA